MKARDLYLSPITLGALSEAPEPELFICEKSGAKFPVIDGIPWLLPDATMSLAIWKSRAVGLIAYYERLVERVKVELENPSLAPRTRERLQATHAMQIRHLEFLRDVLSPLKLRSKVAAEITEAFGYRPPTNQSLQGYFPNLLRDWDPQSNENELSAQIVRDVAGSEPLGRMLVLGAGACRLAYDLHEGGGEGAVKPQLTVCADINPVLFLSARRILRGEKLRAVESPIAPKNLAAAAGRERECRAPKAVSEGFHQVFADVYYLPFASGSFDTIVTPWLIDILPRPFENLLAEIHRCLKPGGRWLNSGSLNFQLRAWADCISPEECLELASANGFQSEEWFQREVPYLLSDIDAHRRFETVTAFRLRKTGPCAVKTAPVPIQPLWLRDPNAPVPPYPNLPSESVTLESQHFVLSLVDGTRGLGEIATAVSQRYGLSLEQAMTAVSTFLLQRQEAGIYRF